MGANSIAGVQASPRGEPSRMAPVDGLRGVAILLVLLFHFVGGFLLQLRTQFHNSAVECVSFSGWSGVDLFFVLSGFLITGILLDQWRQPGFFRDFYWKRVLRIFPLYYSVLVVLFFVAPLLGHFRELADDQTGVKPWLFFHVQNFYIVWHKSMIPGGLNHFWSLAVEVQFYLFWPLVVYACRRKTLGVVCLGIMAGILGLRMGLLRAGVSPFYIYALTFTRLDCFAAGGLAAVVLRSGTNKVWLVRSAGAVVLLSFAGLAVLCRAGGGFLNCIDHKVQTFGFSLLATFFSSLLVVALTVGSRNPIAMLLSVRPFRFLARYSFGIYVVHFPIMGYVELMSRPERFSRPVGAVVEKYRGLVFVGLGFGLSIALGCLSYHLLEKHFLRLGARRRASASGSETLLRPPSKAIAA